MPPFQAIARTAALMFLLLSCFAAPAFAQVYKWIDDEGKTHFTDNIETVPEEYRSQLNKHKLPEPTTVEPGDKAAPETVSEGDKESPDSGKKAEEEKPAGSSPEELAAAQEAIGFLTGSIARYETYEESIPNEFVTRQINDLFQADLPAKEALAAKLEAMEMPVLKETAGFLKASLAADKEFRAIGPNLPFLTRQTSTRLKTEREKKSALIEKLESALEQPAPPAPE